ncbi:DnaB-like helicase N-terminal domain-containing protein [Cellulomonas algicola]|uniref:DnaB-like helicase N-terminal domain-containing protein n=1 Tax=Cellulomonas algicola TaxID=2071633 RepID=UPI001C3FEC1E|nr:DnaB-like helicase N-terminal domain-containing protein [Cellulomonas algicola]
MTNPPVEMIAMRHDELVRLAEQATLGGLMLRPEALGSVRPWLRADDFADSWHGQVYTALLEREPVGGRDPHSMAAVLVDRLGTRRANLPRFADLIHMTPPAPEPAEYARMVAGNGLRREVAGLGVLLQAAALASANDLSAGPLTATCSLVDAGLDRVDMRWSGATGTPHDDVVVPLQLRAAARNTGRAARLAADKYLTAHPPRDHESERQHVALLVGSLISHPGRIPDVGRWLPPTRIEDAGWRVLYGATLELAELGRHVDVLTVAWAAAAHAHHGPELPSLALLRQTVDDAWYVHPPEITRLVAADQARQIADVGAEHLQAAASNVSLEIGDLVDAGRAVTTTLRTIASALEPRPATEPTTVRIVEPPAITAQGAAR